MPTHNSICRLNKNSGIETGDDLVQRTVGENVDMFPFYEVTPGQKFKTDLARKGNKSLKSLYKFIYTIIKFSFLIYFLSPLTYFLNCCKLVV